MSAWQDVATPFPTGYQKKNPKGTTLGWLSENDPSTLKWLADNYQPKPWQGKIQDKDIAFRNALNEASNAMLGGGTDAEPPARQQQPSPERQAPPRADSAPVGVYTPQEVVELMVWLRNALPFNPDVDTAESWQGAISTMHITCTRLNLKAPEDIRF